MTVLVHGDLSVDLNRAFALANFAFAGALPMVLAHGAGALSLDKVEERKVKLRYHA